MNSPTGKSKLVFSIAIALALPALAGCAAPEGGDGGTGTGGGAVTVKTTCGGNVLGGESASAATTGGASALTNVAWPFDETPDEILAANRERLQENLGQLQIGSILPLTGGLSDFGPDMRNGVQLAVDQLNEAANLEVENLITVTHLSEDSKTSPDEAPSAINKLVGQGVDAVVGAASSGVSASILNTAVENGVVVVTPASTGPALSDPGQYDNQGYFFRVPPSDLLQGQVLAKLVWDDGCESATVFAVNNPYGQGLAQSFESRYAEMGGDVTDLVYFDEETATFSAEIEAASNSGSDAVIFVGYPGEGVPFVQQAYEGGLLANQVLFFSEGVFSGSFPTNAGVDILNGLGGTTPAAFLESGTEEFRSMFEDAYGNAPQLFTAESYDAAIAIGLAAVAAESTDGAMIKEKMREVWNPPGLKTSDVRQALAAVVAGQEVDWAGPSGDFVWDDNGDPTSGLYSYWFVTEDGSLDTVGRFLVTSEGIEEQ